MLDAWLAGLLADNLFPYLAIDDCQLQHLAVRVRHLDEEPVHVESAVAIEAPSLPELAETPSNMSNPHEQSK